MDSIACVMNPAKFWSERWQSLGHTGWGDPVIYAYDQLDRLEQIRAALPEIPARGHALDFGCGTGDFSRLLIESGYTVCGYDPFVKPLFTAPAFRYASDLEQIPLEKHTVDLVLSVTALDHIMDDAELRAALDFIHSRLKRDGVFLLAEYAYDTAREGERFHNDYQAFRAFTRWTELLAQSSLTLVSTIGMPQPVISPSPGFETYSRSWPVRLRRRLGSCVDPMLRWQAARVLHRSRTIHADHSDSPLKLMTCKVSQ